MPSTIYGIANLVVLNQDGTGYVTEGQIPAVGNLDYTPNTYQLGCQIRDMSTGNLFINTGTILLPVWTKVSKTGGSFSQGFVGAITMPLFGPSGSPVGFTGIITGVRGVNGTATATTLIFSKNGSSFATLVLAATVGLNVGSPIGAIATGYGSPLGGLAFLPTDLLTVQNSASSAVEVIVDFN